ncbi:5-methyltetrahydropteroyltriglutamate--homocysteine S-methyltransferase [Clostridium felsineum]|uniref:5-methyltetrahydropteroyltriglutamate--homocysteine methyltransferase n=1 Tax=Clostridium felsineum TaxID=36839 RepID=A0A1S8L0M0_9CLOT|nr:5-methyltetrahydropteroyltriglutamate--homocysteine S-methyltransferase [Clostridium felsineum]URZ09180.1 5-methyltetrahydropteroyltriglutamate--homocysteine methyltransferase [Clostridium felsineum]URZ13866.1 5-methyltetrahydropteroyltriglutamate--homocysteine methyltransferase [Clostridium felsineum]
MKVNAPFRYDVVGSFLRPSALKKARSEYKAGKITKEELKTVEDLAIITLIEKQKKAGLKTITDGEFRRSSWHLDFMWAFNGVGHSKTEKGIPFNGEPALIDDTFLTGKVSIENHTFVEHFKFVKQFEDENTVARQTIPAPAQFLFQMITPDNIKGTKAIYTDEEELIKDIAKAYTKVIKDLYDVGCRNIQFDDCTFGVCVDPNACFILGTDEKGLQENIEKLIRINNLVIEEKPEDLVINTHICRGNFHSTWACTGGYNRVAQDLFAKENVNAFYLEFDDERSGGFEPLKYVSSDKKVVLGLITTKEKELENKEAIIKRINEAAKYVPLERLCLSPQCGFASTEEGNKLTEEDQWAKIKLVIEIAKEVWK